MFTLLPSLYLVAVHYIRRWNTPYYYEEEEEKKTFENEKHVIDVSDDVLPASPPPPVPVLPSSPNPEKSVKFPSSLSTRSDSFEKNGYLPNINHDEENQNKDSKLRAKKPTRSSSLLNVERRKTYTGDLTEDDIGYLMNETEFTREQILLWYSDFLVCNSILSKQEDFSHLFFFIAA